MASLQLRLNESDVEEIVERLEVALLERPEPYLLTESFSEMADAAQPYFDAIEELENNTLADSSDLCFAVEAMADAYTNVWEYEVRDDLQRGKALLLSVLEKPLIQLLNVLRPYVKGKKSLDDAPDELLFINPTSELEQLRRWLESQQDHSHSPWYQSTWAKLAAGFAIGWWMGSGSK